MKIVIMMILLLISCPEPIAVGGDFGRTWINSFLAQNHKPVEQNNSVNLSSWGGMPKGKALVDGKLADQQIATKPLNPSASWLGDNTSLGNPSSPMNGTFKGPLPVLFVNKATIKSIHKMDASWNKTLQGPQPDANGPIQGWSAEAYDAIGPVLDYF